MIVCADTRYARRIEVIWGVRARTSNMERWTKSNALSRAASCTLTCLLSRSSSRPPRPSPWTPVRPAQDLMVRGVTIINAGGRGPLLCTAHARSVDRVRSDIQRPVCRRRAKPGRRRVGAAKAARFGRNMRTLPRATLRPISTLLARAHCCARRQDNAAPRFCNKSSQVAAGPTSRRHAVFGWLLSQRRLPIQPGDDIARPGHKESAARSSATR